MGWDGIYRRDPVGDQPAVSTQCAAIQRKAGGGSYAAPLGLVVNGRYDGPTATFVADFQRFKTRNGVRLPTNPAAGLGDCDYATKLALGVIPSAIVTEKPPPAVAYPCPGTWGVWHDGPHFWTASRLDPKRFYTQGVQWNTGAFLQPDPQHSYVEARAEGAGELVRVSLLDPRPKVWIGYSMGADVVTRALYAWPIERRGEILLVVKMGDPGKLPGTDATGSNSVNGGISRVWTPDWARDRTLSYQIKGDMYGDAPGLLPFGYEVLTRMEASGEFLFYLFGLLTGIPVDAGAGGVLGGLGGLLGLGGPLLGGPAPSAPANPLGQQLLGVGGPQVPGFGMFAPILGLITPGPASSTSGPISLAAMLLNIPAIIQSLVAALEFLFTNAHGKYGGTGSAQIFNGTDAVIDAANRINALPIAA